MACADVIRDGRASVVDAVRSTDMNKRLRKKKRVGEFQEFGFDLRGDLRPGLDDAEFDAFIHRLIDLAESRGLAFGGGAGRGGKLVGFVTRAGRGSATEADRAALTAFVVHDDAVVRREVGPLRDACYGSDS